MTTSNITHFLPFLLLLAVLAVWINGSCAKVPDEDDHATFLGGPICPSPDTSLYYRPVIGILTHPGDGAGGKLIDKISHIPASYVKFVESGGARVIPIIYNEPEVNINQTLELVNGVLFTGGVATTPLYTNVTRKIFKTVLEKNDAGNHFPLYGMALGFEQLSIFVSENHNILEKIAAHDQASMLHFDTRDLEGTVFQSFPPELLNKASTKCLAMHNSRVGISRESFEKNSKLSNFFNILTTSVDANNKKFVSTAQAHKYPIVGFQWVPPKNAFEWGNKKIPHTEDAIRVTQQTANYFISEARKSKTKPDETKVLAHLIYNYQPVYTGKEGKGYDQVYLFP